MTIPPQWASSKFHHGSDSARYNEVVALKPGLDGKLYMAAFGAFQNDTAIITRPGVSVSSDKGSTWSNFDILPIKVKREYEQSIGVAADSLIFNYFSKDFVPMNNGDFSFLMSAFEIDRSKDSSLWARQIVEAYKSSGQWKMRKVADLNSYLYYQNDTLYYVMPLLSDSNRLGIYGDFELQLARSLDGQNLVVKWIDLVNMQNTTLSYKTTYNIFLASRKADSDSSWSTPLNITNDDYLDKCTLIPDLVPNNLKDIPIIELRPITILTSDDSTIIERDVEAKQYTMIGHFDLITGVNNNNTPTMPTTVTVYPNPANSSINVKVSDMQVNTELTIEIYNILGEHIANLFSGTPLTNSPCINYNVSNLTVGVYYCIVNNGGHSISQQINIIR
jgi:hypothetical protein